MSRRRRRWLLALSLLAVLLSFGGWWIDRQLEPERLTATVLKKVGESLQLDLRFEGEPDYAFKPEPRLLIPNFSVRGADGKVFLLARRAEISLPWSTIRGDEPVITRIELDQPVLDLPGMRRWLATRPKTPFEVPTLTKGLRVSDGTINDDGYAISQLDLQLPSLKDGAPVEISAQGSFAQETTVLAFDAQLSAATAGLDSDFVLRSVGSLQQSPEPVKFKLDSAGHYVSDDAKFSIDAKSLDLEADSPLPDLRGKGRLIVQDAMTLDFDGVLLNWPAAWPALPDPLAADSENLPLLVSYVGKSDLSDPLSLTMTREPTELKASVRIADIRQWTSTPDGSPVPPLNATLRTPSLVLNGIELEGVEVEITDDLAPESTSQP